MRASVDGRRARGAATRARILEAAEELFAAAGPRATSLRAIARQAGLTHAGVLRHFATKDHLLIELVAGAQERMSSQYAGRVDQSEPAELLEQIARDSQAAPRRIELYTVLLGEAIRPEHPAHDFIPRRLDELTAWSVRTFGDQGVDLLAAWDGLQLMWLYLPDRIDPAAMLGAALRRKPVDPDQATAADAWPDRLAAEPFGQPSPPSDRQSMIIEAAASAFAQTGYQSTSMRAIATELGVSHGVLSYYFASKEALLEAVLTHRDEYARALATIKPDRPLDYLYNAYRRAVFNNQQAGLIALYSVLCCEATDPNHPAHEYFRRRFTTILDAIAGIHAQLIASGDVSAESDPEWTACWLIGLWEGLQLHSFYREDLDVPGRLFGELRRLTVCPD